MKLYPVQLDHYPPNCWLITNGIRRPGGSLCVVRDRGWTGTVIKFNSEDEANAYIAEHAEELTYPIRREPPPSITTPPDPPPSPDVQADPLLSLNVKFQAAELDNVDDIARLKALLAAEPRKSSQENIKQRISELAKTEES